MPEYLAPGVYVEEVDTGSKPIEGVSTSTSGMVGVTERGPVNETTLVTGFADYRRRFGGFLNRRVVTGANWLFPHSVDGFFTNGGKRLYVVRVLPDVGDLRDDAALRRGQRRLLRRARKREPSRRALRGRRRSDEPRRRATGCSSRTACAPSTSRRPTADVLALRSPLAAGGPESDAVTPYTFAAIGGGGALATNPTNATAAGDDQIVLDLVTGLTATGGDILSIGAGNTAEFVVTATADPTDNTVPVTLASPLAFDHPTADNVVLVDATAAPGTQLSQAVPPGGRLIAVDDETPLAGRRRDRVRARHADRVLHGRRPRHRGPADRPSLPARRRDEHRHADAHRQRPRPRDPGRRGRRRRGDRASPSATTSPSGWRSCSPVRAAASTS